MLASLLALPLQARLRDRHLARGGLHGDVLGEVVHTRFGSLMIVRAVAWALLGAILLVAARRGRMPTLRPARRADGHALNRPVSPELIALVVLPIASLLVSPALAGHARTQSPQALLFPADVVHVPRWRSGSAAWRARVRRAGGGARLGPPAAPAVVGRDGLALLGRRARRGRRARGVRHGSGGVRGRERSALVDTGYGRIVLAKALAARRADRVRRGKPDAADPGARPGRAAASPERIWRVLRRNVRIEVALIAVVLASRRCSSPIAPPSDTSSARPRRRRRAACPAGRRSAT